LSDSGQSSDCASSNSLIASWLNSQVAKNSVSQAPVTPLWHRANGVAGGTEFAANQLVKTRYQTYILTAVSATVALLGSCTSPEPKKHETPTVSSTQIILRPGVAPNSIDLPDRAKQSHSYSNCTLHYSDGNTNVNANSQVWISEVYCNNPTIQNGIFVSDTSGTKRYNWFDGDFNVWAREEGCNDNFSCYYSVTINGEGVITELIYHFSINLSEGLIVLENSMTDSHS